MSDPTIFTYTVRDELGTEASTLVYANYNGTLETVDGLVGEWLAYGGLIDAATSGQIVGGAIKIPATPDGSWKTAPAAGSRVEQTALLNFHPTGSNKRQGFDIPALVNTAIAAGKIVTASGPINDIITAILAGFTNGHFADNFAQTLGSFADAAVTFRKHRKQLMKSTEVFTD